MNAREPTPRRGFRQGLALRLERFARVGDLAREVCPAEGGVRRRCAQRQQSIPASARSRAPSARRRAAHATSNTFTAGLKLECPRAPLTVRGSLINGSRRSRVVLPYHISAVNDIAVSGPFPRVSGDMPSCSRASRASATRRAYARPLTHSARDSVVDGVGPRGVPNWSISPPADRPQGKARRSSGTGNRSISRQDHNSSQVRGPPLRSFDFHASMSSMRHATARRPMRSGGGKRPSLIAA